MTGPNLKHFAPTHVNTAISYIQSKYYQFSFEKDTSREKNKLAVKLQNVLLVNWPYAEIPKLLPKTNH